MQSGSYSNSTDIISEKENIKTNIVSNIKLNEPIDFRAVVIFCTIITGSLFYMVYSIYSDVIGAGGIQAIAPFILLGVALVIALGFEFVNGFHDTANAVATVIYTRTLRPNIAVVWSGCFNLLGVLLSSGAVAFGIVSLLPVELILQVGSAAGYSMVFALLISAIIWNLGTWWAGLPVSSSHTMIGSILGVGIANALMRGQSGMSGVNWSKVTEIGEALLFSPIFGFVFAALLLLSMKFFIRNKTLYSEPKTDSPPPLWIRALLIFTCTGVSFFHGSNDGQKGMGLIMLILIGVAPTAYALNRYLPPAQTDTFIQETQKVINILESKSVITTTTNVINDPRPFITEYIHSHKVTPELYTSMDVLIKQFADQVKLDGSLNKTPFDKVQNVRNDMYLSSEAINTIIKDKTISLSTEDKATLSVYKKDLDLSIKFIPTWVKVMVAIALGLGTMVGWKRIVVTVGEKIGKTHLTYGQGAAAEVVAMATIGAADGFGLPVSTTHVLSSGIAGTMAANGSGMQWSTLRNIALGWILTLPAATLLSGTLYFIFRSVVDLF
jgi:PiT family inorganic phosphate transporter